MRTTKINKIRDEVWADFKKKYNREMMQFTNWGIINEAMFLAIQRTEKKLTIRSKTLSERRTKD